MVIYVIKYKREIMYKLYREWQKLVNENES